MRWLVLAAIAASTTGCKQLLGFDDPARATPGGDAAAAPDAQPIGCTQHSDCASDACLPDGSCGDDTNVAYVSSTGSGTTCTLAAPCATFGNGLATLRPYVKVSGAIGDTVNITRAVTVLADPGAKLTGLSGSSGKPTLQIGASVAVAIYDLEITGSTKAGIQLAGGNPTVTLERVTIANNPGMGVQASGGTIDIHRSVIEGNGGGGIDLSGAMFDLENDFIIANGDATSSFGGVEITGSSSGTLAFDTIAENVAGPSAVAGVQCTSSVQPGAFADDLIYGNNGSEVSLTAGSCVFTYSDVGPDGTDGTGITDVDPLFVSTTDFHLQSTSPCIDIADPAATQPIDFDGQPRPYGPRSDIGADEYVP